VACQNLVLRFIGGCEKTRYNHPEIFHGHTLPTASQRTLRKDRGMSDQARIIVIDYDETIRKLIATVLEGAGYLVDTAKSGKEAIEKTSSRFYNLALIDIRLPDMEGTQLLTAIKETTPKIIKIMLTGYPSTQNAIDAVNGGADEYIVFQAEWMNC